MKFPPDERVYKYIAPGHMITNYLQNKIKLSNELWNEAQILLSALI